MPLHARCGQPGLDQTGGPDPSAPGMPQRVVSAHQLASCKLRQACSMRPVPGGVGLTLQPGCGYPAGMVQGAFQNARRVPVAAAAQQGFGLLQRRAHAAA